MNPAMGHGNIQSFNVTETDNNYEARIVLDLHGYADDYGVKGSALRSMAASKAPFAASKAARAMDGVLASVHAMIPKSLGRLPSTYHSNSAWRWTT